MNDWDVVANKVRRFKNEDYWLIVEQQKNGKWRYTVQNADPVMLIGSGRNVETMELAQQLAENTFSQYKLRK